MLGLNTQLFGGRGDASSMIGKGKSYGSEHDTIAAFDRIQFVRYNGGVAASPIETMTAVMLRNW